MKPRTLLAFVILTGSLGRLPAQTPVTFLEPQTFGTGWAQSLAVADFNGDGAMDVATIGSDIVVYLGNGRGSFTAGLPIGLNGTSIVTADFNGDGKPDLAIAGSNELLVLLGNGDGTFHGPVAFAGTFTVLAVGDFNGDGVADIAAGNTTAQVQIFFGSKSGAFKPGPLTTLPTGNPLAIASADFNGDHKTDLAATGVGTSKGISVLLGNGDGTFGTPTLYQAPGVGALVTADFNGDGFPDLAYKTDANSIYKVGILLNKGGGTFTASAPMTIQGGVGALAAADLNGDGIPDLVVDASDLAFILLGKGNGAFNGFQKYVLAAGPNAIAVADFNGDGLPDIVSSNGGLYDTSQPLTLLLGKGAGKFRSSLAFNAGPNATGIAAADLNRDGNLDLVVADNRLTSPSIAVLNGNGAGSFAPAVHYPANDPTAVAVADVNLDGKLDIVFAGFNSIGTLPAKGDGAFGLAIYSPCPHCTSALLVGDFNRDGKPDLVTWQIPPDGVPELALLLGNGDGTFRPPVATYLTSYPGYMAAADFNKDGYLDVAVSTNSDLFGTYILLNNGDGTFGNPILINGAQELAAVGDFNGDGNADLALSKGAIYLGNGNGTFTPAFTIPSPGAAAIAGDFNGDGILDLVGNGTVLLGKGDGNFVAQTQTFVFDPGTALAVTGDFGNGKLDIATVSYGGPVWLLLNTTGK